MDLERLTGCVRAAGKGDEPAFRELYRWMHPRLVRYLSTIVGGDAEDVASESWLQVVRDLPNFKGDFDHFRAFVTTVARHRAIDLLRKRSRRPVTDAGEEHLAAIADPRQTADIVLDGMSTDAALALIGTLPPDQAEAVLLRVVIGLDAKSAGKVLGKRAGAVRTASFRGLKRLARLLEDPGPSDTGVTKVGPRALKEVR